MKRKTKFLSLILSLILVLVSVPMSVVSEEITDGQDNLSVTQPSGELVEQPSFEEITEFQSNLDVTISNDDLVNKELTNVITSTSASSDSQLVTGIPDGIYAIEIAGLSSYYISYSMSSTSSYASSNSMAVSPTLMGMPAYLFKVTRVPNTDRYIIRSAFDPTKTLCASGDYVIWISISENDSQVSEYNTFNIIGNNGALLIKEVGTGKYICGGGASFLAATESLETQVLTSWRFRGYRSYIEDGVYSFENVGNSDMWASTQNDSYEAGANIQQKSYVGCPIDSFSRGGMFKINRIGNTDQYTIRLMTNNLLAWSVDGSTVVSQDIPPNEADIPNSMRFHIAYDSGNYMIIPYSTYNAVGATQITNSSEIGDDFNYNLNAISRGSISNNAMWKIYKYVGIPLYGGNIILPDELLYDGGVIGNTYTITHTVWYTAPDICNYSLNISEDDVYTSQLTYNSNNFSTTFTLSDYGEVCCYLYLDYTVNNIEINHIADDATFNAMPSEGTYYIRNTQSEKYANVSGLTSSEGEIVHQLDYDAQDAFKWQVEHVSDSGGYIRLKSLSSGLYLGAHPSREHQIYQYSTTSNNTLWRIEKLYDGSVKLICKAYESSGLVLSIPVNSLDDGVRLNQRAYTDDSDYSDEWSIYMITGAVATVNNYYDNGQLLKYGQASIDDINSSQILANEYFMRIFGLIINSNTPEYYMSLPDFCKSFTDFNSNTNYLNYICNENAHYYMSEEINNVIYDCYCSDRISLLYEFDGMESNTTSILWSGHKIRSVDASGELEYNRSCSYLKTILMLSENCDVYTLIHEMAHQFGAPDHYCEEGGTSGECIHSDRCDAHCSDFDAQRSEWCIMDNDNSKIGYTPWEDITTRSIDEIFCDKCYQDILTYIATYCIN